MQKQIPNPPCFQMISNHSLLIRCFMKDTLKGWSCLQTANPLFQFRSFGVDKNCRSQLLAAWNRQNFGHSVASMIESSSALTNINELSAILQKSWRLVDGSFAINSPLWFFHPG